MAIDTVDLQVRLPADLAAMLGDTPDVAARAARQAIVFHLLRAGAVSQSRVAEVLDITRHDVLDLMATYDIASGTTTLEEYLKERERAARSLSGRSPEVRDGASRA